MIRVTCMGHIRSSVGKEVVEIQEERITAGDLIERVRELGGQNPNRGFTVFNTLILVNGTAFPGAARNKILVDGDEVTLLPFSHGG